MEIPAGLLAKYQTPTGPRTPREELVDKFLVRLNQNRDGYPEIKLGRLLKMLEGKKAPELYDLFKTCEGARSFGAMFNYKLKNNKN